MHLERALVFLNTGLLLVKVEGITKEEGLAERVANKAIINNKAVKFGWRESK